MLKEDEKMSKKCIYCHRKITDDRVADICNSCGLKVWGEKMFNTILTNMGEAKDNDDLYCNNLDPEKIY